LGYAYRMTNTATAPTTAPVLKALEDLYSAMRETHPEMPPAVIVIGSGSGPKGGLEKWGHHAPERWQQGEEKHHELMVSGEGLGRSAEEIANTMLHEGAHGLARARGEKDTSRQGRYHNRTFAKIAREVGIVPCEAPDTKHGYSACTLGDEAAQRYAEQIEALRAALTLYRHAEASASAGKEKKDKPEGRVKAECGCGRSFRIVRSILVQAPIMCNACGEPFRAEGVEDEIEDEDEGCQGHESQDGAHMGETVFCDGSCRADIGRE